MNRHHKAVAGLVAGVALAFSALAQAQPAGGPGHGMGPGQGMGMGPGHGMGMGPGHGPGAGRGMGPGHGPMADVDPAARAEAHLVILKSRLKITADQEGAWKKFADATKSQAGALHPARVKAQEGAAVPTAPERMAQHAAQMQQRGAAMASMAKSLGELYGSLTKEQKAIIDQRGGMHGPGAMGGMGAGMGRGRHHD